MRPPFEVERDDGRTREGASGFDRAASQSKLATAASIAPSAVKVSGQSPTASTLAAPMNSTAVRTRKRAATSATPSYHTVSPER